MKDSPWSHLVDGFRYAYRHRQVRRVLWMMAATTIAGMPAVVLMPFFADDIFHRGSLGLGFLMGAMGVGAVIGTLVLAGRTRLTGLAARDGLSAPPRAASASWCSLPRLVLFFAAASCR